MEMILIYGVMFGLLYFILIRPQKKKQKQLADMREAAKVGDKVVTIGGVVGVVKTVKEDDIHVEVGNDKIILKLKKWAIGSIEE